MKKYFIEFKFIQGEYENYLKYVLESDLPKEEAAHEFIMNYYGEDITAYDEQNEYYYSLDCEEVIMELYGIQEITEEEYTVLAKFI